MPLVIRTNLQHEGLKGVSIFVWEIDTDKPKTWRENGQYKFNKQLVEKFMFHDVEIFLSKLGA